MIKWIVKKYLTKILNNVKYQQLSLEQELGYASCIPTIQERQHKVTYERCLKHIDVLNVILNEILN